MALRDVILANVDADSSKLPESTGAVSRLVNDKVVQVSFGDPDRLIVAPINRTSGYMSITMERIGEESVVVDGVIHKGVGSGDW